MSTKDLVTDAALVGVAGYGAAKVMGKAITFVHEQQTDAARQQEEDASYGVAYDVAARKTAALADVELSQEQVATAGMALH